MRPDLRWAAGALFIFASTTAIFAATPTEYRQNIDTAQNVLKALMPHLDGLDPATEKQALTQIKAKVPVSERIDWDGGSVETDNRWLHDLLEKFSEENGIRERTNILVAAGDRLGAIVESIDELESATRADPNKDSTKQKLAEILRREEYQKPDKQETSLFGQWLNRIWEWLMNAFPRPSLPEGASAGIGALGFGLQILIYVLVIGLVGLFIYKIAPFVFRRIGANTSKARRERLILGDRIEADESSEDLFGEAENLARNGELRAAIRKGYIALLCDLSDRNIIRLARHKTNRDYLRDVKKDRVLFDDMRGLTGKFERNWYGLRNAEQADWDDFRVRYLEAIANVRGKSK